MPLSPRVAAKMVQKLQAENSALQNQLRAVPEPAQSAYPPRNCHVCDASVQHNDSVLPNFEAGVEASSCYSWQNSRHDLCTSCKQAAAKIGGLSVRIASLERLLDSATQRADDERLSHLELKRQYAKIKVRS
jgi:hypothetical protein